jgi:glycosyltransferase involved in cell wall biosynthesis
MATNIAALAGSRVVVLNWRDVRHPQAGGAEQYMHEIARRWTGAGVDVTWLTARGEGQSANDELDGIRIHRAGGALSVYPRAVRRLQRLRREIDAVVDCQNGVPFFSPLVVSRGLPVVQVVHHVHQDQFATRFAPPLAQIGKLLEGPVARRVYGRRPIAAVSPSTRDQLRTRLGFRGPIAIVPNGTVPVSPSLSPRSATPTIVVVSRLVPHKRLELLLGHVGLAASEIPGLRLEIVGDGPERGRLEGLVRDLGLQSTVTFHGYLPAAERDQRLAEAWVTTSTSAAEGWGCSVIEAASWGVPCVALRVPGIRDSVLDGRTGWLVDRPQDFGATLKVALAALADESYADMARSACTEWAGTFSWDRSADLLAGVILGQMRGHSVGVRNRRTARSDMTVLAAFDRADPRQAGVSFRCTDEVAAVGRQTRVVLSGCDEADAAAALQRVGVRAAELRIVDQRHLLAGPAAGRHLTQPLAAVAST